MPFPFLLSLTVAFRSRLALRLSSASLPLRHAMTSLSPAPLRRSASSAFLPVPPCVLDFWWCFFRCPPFVDLFPPCAGALLPVFVIARYLRVVSSDLSFSSSHAAPLSLMALAAFVAGPVSPPVASLPSLSTVSSVFGSCCWGPFALPSPPLPSRRFS